MRNCGDAIKQCFAEQSGFTGDVSAKDTEEGEASMKLLFMSSTEINKFNRPFAFSNGAGCMLIIPIGNNCKVLRENSE